MADIKAFDRLGNRITIDEADVPELEKLGGRTASPEELAAFRIEQSEKAVQDRYDELPTYRKVIGAGAAALSTVAGPLGLSGVTDDAPPTVAAFGAGLRHGLTAGLSDAASRTLADEIGGKEAGDKLATQIDDQRAASPWAHGAGSVTGMVGGAVAGGAGARALPSAGISAVGEVAERGVAKALGGLASKGALGKAAATGAAMAVRGAAEGAAFAATEQYASDVTHDTEASGERYYASVGHGMLLGGGLGAALGIGGSLLSSGAGAVKNRLVKGLARTGDDAAASAPREVPALTAEQLDAGLRETAPKASSPIVAGDELRPMYLRPGGRPRVPKGEAPINIAGDLAIDVDAGIVSRTRSGKFQGKLPSEDALRLSSAKSVPREMKLSVGDELAPAEASHAPIRLPDAPTGASPKGIVGALSDPSNAARDLAYDQAWRSIGAGYGLQSTKYAKQAAKYFPNGTRDLGEVAIRHGIVDMGAPSASPIEAAWSAAKSGTPAEMLPKLEVAEANIGRQIGEVTEASGARVKLADVDKAIGRVRSEVDRIAGNDHVVSSIDNYHASLRSKLAGSADDTASLQAVLEQRKGLDRIVYQETKSLDPGRRVQALRDVRAELEELITKSLDDASGKIPGALRDQYKTLKKDFHALRILREAAEDSAARAAKGSFLGLGEKFAVASSVATGNLTSAPMLALGGKMIRERGNAAAAAFLSRAADRGTFDAIVRSYNARVGKAAANVLAEAPRGAPKPARAEAPRAHDPKAGRAAAAATRSRAQAIVRWVGETRAQPERVTQQLEEASAILGRTAGPKAAAAYTASTLRAIAFIATYVPVRERTDPLDPRSVPPLTYEESDRLIRAARYAAQPTTVWDDFGRGVVTPEGIAAAKAFMPDSFAEFQSQLFAHVQDHMIRNGSLTQSQRLKVDKLLGFGGVRPEKLARLQSDLAPAAPAEESGPAPGPRGNKPVAMTIQQNGFDAVEARKAG